MFAKVSSGAEEPFYTECLAYTKPPSPIVHPCTGTKFSEANHYTLQLNVKPFTTSVCEGPKCTGWEQFVYYSPGTDVFIQYWLIEFENSEHECPSGWNKYPTSVGYDCWKNGTNSAYLNKASFATPTIEQLEGTTFKGTVNTSTTASNCTGLCDEVKMITTSKGEAAAANEAAILDLAGNWTGEEWGIYGPGNGSEADFTHNTQLTLKTEVEPAGLRPECRVEGYTGETNNLFLTPVPKLVHSVSGAELEYGETETNMGRGLCGPPSILLSFGLCCRVVLPNEPIEQRARGQLPELTVNPASGAGTSVSYGITETGNVNALVSCAPGSGSTFAIGKTTVTCSVTGSAGNVTNVSFVVNVLSQQEQPASCNGIFAASASQVNVPSGDTCVLSAGARISGNVQVQQDGALNDQGAVIGGDVQVNNGASIQVQGGSIGGNLQVQGLAGGPNTLCAASVKGDVQVQNNGPLSQLSIGGPSPGSCAGLTITGNLQAQNNAARVTIEGNAAHGNIEVHNNTGGGALTGNHADGNCKLQNDTPPILGSSNTVGLGHTNTCNGSA
jgi:hypothetical protein